MTAITNAIRDEIDRFALQVAAIVEDGSSVPETELETFVTLRQDTISLAVKWGEHWNQAGSYALQVAVHLNNLRKLILRKDGSPDLAGTSNVYTKLVEPDLRKALDDLKDAGGKGIPLDVFKTRVKQARSDFRENFRTAAQLAVATNPELAATKVPVNVAVMDDDGAPVKKDGVPVTEIVEKTVAEIVAENPAGTSSQQEIPEVLAVAVDEVFATQVNSKGERLPGFRTEDIPHTFGRMSQDEKDARKKARSDARQTSTGAITGTTGEQDDSTNVVPPDAAMVARWARQTKWSEVLPFILRTLSAASDAALGVPGKPAASPNPVMPGGEAKDASELWKQLSDLALQTGGAVVSAPGFGKTKVAPFRWVDPAANIAIGVSNVPAEPESTESTEPEPQAEPESTEPTTEQVLEDLTTPENAEPESTPDA